MEPVREFINWVSLLTVCDKFDSGPVDCNWPASFSRVPSFRAVWSWRNWSRAVMQTGLLSQYGLPSSAITTGSTHSRLLARLPNVACSVSPSERMPPMRRSASPIWPNVVFPPNWFWMDCKSVDEAADAGHELGDLVAESG